MLRLRPYHANDARTILSWVTNEKAFYQWTAGVLGTYPLTEQQFHAVTQHMAFTAIDDEETIGFLTMRRPADSFDELRFGFVIVDPSLRGKGYGKKMLQLGIEYVREKQLASRIDLGVFENNEAAKHCYEAVGFREYGRRECEMPIGTWTCIDMEIV